MTIAVDLGRKATKSKHTMSELASECGISKGSVYTIIKEHLNMSKVSVMWVPRNLNMQDCQQRVESSQEPLEVYNSNPEYFHVRYSRPLQLFTPTSAIHAHFSYSLTYG